MHRGALALGAFMLVVTPCFRALAHGGPPAAWAVLSQDAEGLRAVSLSAGIALRRSAQRYQYVCPMAWGDQFPAPVAALADGTLVVGASRGLMLLGEDGTLRAHPDPAALSSSRDLVRSPGGVFALRTRLEGSEVLAIDAQQVRVLWKDTFSLDSLVALAAVSDKLVVQRARGTMLEQVTITAANGVELERQMAVIDAPADYLYARGDAGAAYALVVFRTGNVTLGSLRDDTFNKLAEGTLSIAGPLRVDDVTLLAPDGRLTQLLDDRAAPLADDHNVVCLAEHDGLTYACDGDGIARVDSRALLEPLFRFEWLEAPDLERVPEGDARMACNAQWQDLLLDLQLSMPGAGGLPPAAGSGVQGAAGGPAAAGGGAIVAAGQPAQEGRASCATLPGRTAPRAAGAFAFGLGLAFALGRHRRRVPAPAAN